MKNKILSGARFQKILLLLPLGIAVALFYQNCGKGFEGMGPVSTGANSSTAFVVTSANQLSPQEKAAVESYVDTQLASSLSGNANLSQEAAPSATGISSKFGLQQAVLLSPQTTTQNCSHGGTITSSFRMAENGETLSQNASVEMDLNYSQCHKKPLAHLDLILDGSAHMSIIGNANPQQRRLTFSENMSRDIQSQGTVTCSMAYTTASEAQLQGLTPLSGGATNATIVYRMQLDVTRSDQADVPVGTRMILNSNSTMTSERNQVTNVYSSNITFTDSIQINANLVNVAGTLVMTQTPCPTNSIVAESSVWNTSYTMLGSSHVVRAEQNCDGSTSLTKDGQPIVREQRYRSYYCLQMDNH